MEGYFTEDGHEIKGEDLIWYVRSQINALKQLDWNDDEILTFDDSTIWKKLVIKQIKTDNYG